MTETPSESFIYLPTRETIFHHRIFPVILGTSRFGAKDPDPVTGYLAPDETTKEAGVNAIIHAALSRNVRIVIDTARAYGLSESVVGEALRLINRDSLFIITKVGIRQGSHEQIHNEIESSVRTLGTTPDMIMMHNRWETGDMAVCIEELLRARDEGHTASIGVSNLRADELRSVIALSGKSIAAYEAKLNLVNPRKDFLDLKAICDENEIPFLASSALDRKSVLQLADNPLFSELSRKYHMTVAQLGIYAVRLAGAIPVVMSKNPEHLNEDFKAATMGMEQSDADQLLAFMMGKVTH